MVSLGQAEGWLGLKFVHLLMPLSDGAAKEVSLGVGLVWVLSLERREAQEWFLFYVLSRQIFYNDICCFDKNKLDMSLTS